jgi:hypothetical protein
MVEHVEDFLTLYIGVKALKEGMTLETLELAAPCFRNRRTSQRRLQETMTMSVYIHGGVAFFSSSGAYPSERELHDAIELGLETEFPAYLERIDSSITVEDITYTGTTFAPTPARTCSYEYSRWHSSHVAKSPKWKNLLVTRKTMEK